MSRSAGLGFQVSVLRHTPALLLAIGLAFGSVGPAYASLSESAVDGGSSSGCQPTLFGLADPLATGGTESNPYLLDGFINGVYSNENAVNQLLEVGDCISSDNSIYPYYRLASNIDLAPITSWFPLNRGNSKTDFSASNSFNGVFDGGGFLISNMKIDDHYRTTNAGLFGALRSGSVVKNLRLEGTITAIPNSTGTSAFGLLAGTSWGATIDNVDLFGIIEPLEIPGSLGGMIGYWKGAGSVSDSTISVTVASKARWTGGVVGRIQQNSAVLVELADIVVSERTRQIASQNVTRGSVTGTYNAYSVFTGGLIGMTDMQSGAEAASVDVNRTTVLVNVTANNGVVGGLIGEAKQVNLTQASVGSGVKSVAISLTGTSGNGMVGGLVARATDLSFSESSFHGDAVFEVNSGFALAVGGLVGIGSSVDLTQSYSTGSVRTSSAKAGGLAGILNNGSIVREGVSAAQVLHSTNTTLSYTGGLVGQLDASQIHDSLSLGQVTTALSGSDAMRHATFVGYAKDATISNSLSLGTLTGQRTEGGLIGELSTNSTAASSYWNKKVSTRSSSLAGTELSNAGLRDESSYVGWDFVNTWEMGTCAPRLRSAAQFELAVCPTDGFKQRTVIPGSGVTLSSTTIYIEVSECPANLNTFTGNDRFTVLVDSVQVSATLDTSGCLPGSFLLTDGQFVGLTIAQMIFRDQEISFSYSDLSAALDGNTDVLKIASGADFDSLGAPILLNPASIADSRNRRALVDKTGSSVSADGLTVSIPFLDNGHGIAFGASPESDPNVPIAGFRVIVDGEQKPYSSISLVAPNTVSISLNNPIPQEAVVSAEYFDRDPSTLTKDAESVVRLSLSPNFFNAKPEPLFQITNNSTRQRPTASVTLTASASGISAVASCSSGCNGALPDSAVFELRQNGNVVATNSTGIFSGLSEATPYVMFVTVIFGGMSSNPVSQQVTTDTFPKLVSRQPASGSQAVSLLEPITFTFSEPMARGTGNLTIHSGPTCSIVEQTISASDTSRVTISGSTVTISMAGANALPYSTEVCIEMAAGFVTDLAGNNFAGLTAPSSSEFTTEADTTPSSNPNPAPPPAPAPANPSPAPTPEPTPTDEPEPTPTAVATPQPSPGPRVTVTPTPTPAPTQTAAETPAVTPTPTPTPSAEPEVTAEAVPTPTQDVPEPEPTETVTARPQQPKTVTITEITSGQIELTPGQDAVVLPAALLEEVVFTLAPADAPLDQGVLQIDTQVRRLEILVVELGTVTFSAAELGNSIEFTLVIPGFEPNSLTVQVSKGDLAFAGWLSLAATLVVASLVLWFILGARRRRRTS